MREVRKVRENKATALPGSLGFTLFYVRGHQAGCSALLLTDNVWNKIFLILHCHSQCLPGTFVAGCGEGRGLDLEAQAVSR